jgi:hypothetical protein
MLIERKGKEIEIEKEKEIIKQEKGVKYENVKENKNKSQFHEFITIPAQVDR